MSENINIENKDCSSGEWYSLEGADNDVVLSTRVRLARNLADFPFPQKFRSDDSMRVQTLVFDSFLKAQKADSYQTVAVAGIDPLNARVLIERGLMEKSTLTSPGAGLVMRINGKKANSGLVCAINDVDHVRISCFAPGLDCDSAYKNCHEVDELLQKNLQFAASYDFGYLTANVKDCGSGMKISARVHLPAMAFSGQTGPFFESIIKKGVVAEPAFSSYMETGASIGGFYQLSSTTAAEGSELDQLANFTTVLRHAVESERRSRDFVLHSRTTEITDRILKSYSVAKYSLLLDLREALLIISDIKLGRELKVISGIENTEITAMLYRLQEAHLKTVINNGTYDFPADIAENPKKQVERFRALIVHDALENSKLYN